MVQLSDLTGGGELVSPEEAFAHNLPSASFAIEIWRQLLLAVALLFPLDVAIRRLLFGKEDLLEMGSWVETVFKRQVRSHPDEPRVLNNLFEARDRARRKSDQVEKPDIRPIIEKRAESEKPVDTDAGTSLQDQDTLSRLRQAKKRAHKDNQDEPS